MKAIIIDDEKQARVSLRLLLEEFCPEVEILQECENLPDAVLAIRKLKPEILFLDIEMPGFSGLQILDFFDEKDIDFSIIFTTAYNEFAIQAFKLSAVDYLLKPIIPDELCAAVAKTKKQNYAQFQSLSEQINSEKPEKIAVPSGSDLLLLNLSEIRYIKGEGSYSEIFMINNTKYLVSRNLKNFEEVLCDNKRFIRIHKSYIINFDQAVSFNKSSNGWLSLQGGVKVPVSSDKTSFILDKISIIKR